MDSVDCEACKSILVWVGLFERSIVKFMMVPPFFFFLHRVLLLLTRVRIVDQKENNENGGTDQSEPSDVKWSP